MTSLVQMQNFGRGEISSFLMKCPEEIGTPVSLQIWHDNSEGNNAGWYLGKVVFIDLQYNRWLYHFTSHVVIAVLQLLINGYVMLCYVMLCRFFNVM